MRMLGSVPVSSKLFLGLLKNNWINSNVLKVYEG